jgi:glycosyltransferase involved in cell wall biosynthesis
MIIAVNARFLLKDKLEGIGYFTREVLQQLVNHHPDHQFHLFFDRDYQEEFLFRSNVVGHKVFPPARHPLLWKYWFDIAIPYYLRKVKADVFVSPDGFCSLTTRVPQCLVVHDLGFLHYPEAYKRSHYLYYKLNTGKFLKKASSIACVSEFTRKDIIEHYKVKALKIHVVYSGVKSIFQPVDELEKQKVKDRFSVGAEFFICVGAIQPRKNLVNLLKAFSIFKKRLQSGMKLVLAGRMAWKNEEFTTLLNSYKYKEDVIITGYLGENDLATLVASAYGLVYPSLFEGFGVPVLEAMNCNIPVLTSKGSSMEEISADAALYFDPVQVNDIAEKLMLIYKDEALRKSLIEKASVVARNYSWQRTSELMWNAIIEAKEKQNQF